MAYNKIQKSDGTVLIDLTNDTVTEDSLVEGYTAHAANGQIITGTQPKLTGVSGIFRGKNLGSGTSFANASTSEQRNAISSGTFENLFVGDYWTINGRVYRIAHINYWYNITNSNSEFTTNHLAIVPDLPLASAAMNSSASTIGGYNGASVRNTLGGAKSIVTNDFGNYILSHMIVVSSSTEQTYGMSSATTWVESTVDLMTEMMVIGSKIHNRFFDGVDESFTDGQKQLKLFDLNSTFINYNKNAYWLRDVASNTQYSLVNTQGIITTLTANSTSGIRPVFAIKGSA